MHKYVIRRLLLAIPVLLLSSLIVFGLMRVMPGDALVALMGESGNVGERELAKLRKDLGLDRPYHEQYLIWVWQMVSLNPGDSIFTNEPIPVALKKSIPVTLELATLALILGLAIAIPVGVLSATRQDKPSDYVGRVVAVSGLSLPDFWLGTLVITFAAIWFRWMPPIGYVSIWDDPWRNLQQFLLPAAVLGFRLSAATMRMTRSTVLEVLREDYVRTAWAKGLGGRMVVYKHALKNALIPVVTNRRWAARNAPGRHRGRGDDLRAAGDGPADGRGDLVPRLSRRADQRHAGRGSPGHAQPGGRPHVRVARPADPVSMSPPVSAEPGRLNLEVPVTSVTAAVAAMDAPASAATPGRARALWRALKRNPLGLASAAVLSILVLTAVFADVLAPYDPLATQPEIRLAPPSRAHLFGTDDIGRDVFSRIIHGARISLWVGLLAVGLGTFAGMIIGLACGYWEGRLDIILQRVMDAIQSIPGLMLALAIVSVLKPSTTNAMLAIAVVIIPGNSRIVRGAVLSAKQNRYVEAAEAIGCRQPRILVSHILPNVTAPILIIASIWLGNAILIEATLSFLGLGTQPPTPSWGLMLSSTGRAYMEQAPWLAIFPGLAISLAVLGFNLFGDTLRDAWDPRLRRG
jgi:peptide/nickel transport system permease protein